MRSICFFGDNLMRGAGDIIQGGWVTRACMHEIEKGKIFCFYNLAIDGETSRSLKEHWQIESDYRSSPESNNLKVFCFGVNDMDCDYTSDVNIPLPETVENAEAIMKEASKGNSLLWIGPYPSLSIITDSKRNLRKRNERLECLNELFLELAQNLGIPYLDVFEILSNNPDWKQSLFEGGGEYPNEMGHLLFAKKIVSSEAWRAWVDNQDVWENSKKREEDLKKIVPLPFTPKAF